MPRSGRVLEPEYSGPGGFAGGDRRQRDAQVWCSGASRVFPGVFVVTDTPVRHGCETVLADHAITMQD